jgi:hypothetical protein
MQALNFKTFINGASNDLKIAIDDIISAILIVQEDVDKFKITTSKPDKRTAKALLEYIAMEDSKAKENIDILCGKEIQQYLRWLDDYCKGYPCTSEQALNDIINCII